MIFSSPLKSFQVDSLTKRWVAFMLFILVWGVSFCFFFMPFGDPDFSQYLYWLEDMMKSEDYVNSFASANPFGNVLTVDNLIYLGTALLYLFFLALIAWFYFVVFTCERRGVPFSKAPIIFIKRVWWMILLVIVAFIPFLLVCSILPVVLLFYLPAMYAIPGLVFFEKKDSFTAIPRSFRKTTGHKLPILLEWLLFFAIYSALMSISHWVLNEGSAGIALVEAFVSAYFTLVLGRHMGIRYHMMMTLCRE